MKKVRATDKKRHLLTGIAILILAIAGGLIGEFLYNLPVKKEADYRYFSEQETETQGFQIEDGVFVSTKGGAKITFRFEEQYVDKFYYEYDYEGKLDAVIYVGDYSQEDSAKSRRIKDHNNYTAGSSTVNIRNTTDEITIRMPAEAEHVNIRAAGINNTENHSLGRILFYSLVTAFVLMLILILRKNPVLKPENIFLFLSVGVGVLMILTLPPHKVGLDEEIHFGRAYYLFDTLAGKETVTVTPVMNDLITTSVSNWPYNIPQSEEEMKQEEAYWNAGLSWNSGQASTEYQQNNYTFHLYTLSYLPQAVMIKAGEFMHLEFTWIYRMGRLGSLILYCLVVYFAIRHIPWGKRIMLVMALMPTAMFSAVTYTYDVTVTSFTFLGIAYLLPELMDDGGKLSYKNFGVFTIAFVLASLPKPIYIPMIGLAWFIPASRFRSRSQQRLCRGILLTVFLGMLATFALEPLFNANQAGDARGGDTGVGRQLRYIFAHPIRYAALLLESIRRKFFSFTLGYRGLGQMGHLSGDTGMVTAALLAVGVTLTDHTPGKKRSMTVIQSVASLFLCFVTICLIWTALYLSFTPVGADIIRGVQGRYYLPVTMLMLLALPVKYIDNKIPEHIDLALLTLFSGSLLLFTVYGSVIVNVF